MSQCPQKSGKAKPSPIILRKDNLLLNSWITTSSQSKIIRESVIYESTKGDFLKADYKSVTIVNKYNVLTHTSQTVAKCETIQGTIIEKTSDKIARLIGQANYDILFSSLCSVISLELKIRSLLSILSEPSKLTDSSCQTVENYRSFEKTEASTQTEDCMELFDKRPLKKRTKRRSLAPYVVQNSPVTKTKGRRLIVPPEVFKQIYTKPVCDEESQSADLLESQVSDTGSKCPENIITPLPELKSPLNLDETSRDSIGNLSLLSSNIPDSVLTLDWINNHTEPCTQTEEIRNNYPIKMMNGDILYVSEKPESWFHIATKHNLMRLSPQDREKLLCHQAYIDYKYCLTRTDGNLPIHEAVMNNDTELLRRHCPVLTRVKKESVDIPNVDNVTPLQMSLRQDSPECLSILLASEADPLATDDEHRTPLHVAAECGSGHVKVILDYCRNNARKILASDEDLWRDRFENSSEEALGKHLLQVLNNSYDDQGYTPLMLASCAGKYANLELLLESDPTCVNIRAPNSGDTALFQAVRAACLNAADRGNKSAVANNFANTIKILLQYGGDPNIQNLAGFSANDLVTDCNNKELSMLVANCMAANNAGKLPPGSTVVNGIIITETASKRGKGRPAPKVKTGAKKNINNASDSIKATDSTLAGDRVNDLDTTGATPTLTQPRLNYIDKYQNFLKNPPQPKIVILKDEQVTPSIPTRGVKRKISSVTSHKKKKDDK